MQQFFNSHLGRFRLISLVEGISYILLMGVGMPLKYMFTDHADLTELGTSLVTMFGRAHGGLVVLFIVFGALAAMSRKWDIEKMAILFLASLIPFGAFWAEKKYLAPEAKAEAAQATA
ncbi:DUF3817 domain-containing protein [Pontibacter sp. G13]|uniref:DUF3817 domain-containing protein n=1 Tax=Pontibacter sp. G13 TaxID=3074898 RepID=UPI00288AC38D|nr:DUF3817 domain-containing protein [Pontibacter sp. G13]WNJ16848.1 DUF3817 domain-containing protein [Pontibacter sp. G13]